MDWFTAYVLWKLNAFQELCAFFFVILALGIIGAFVYRYADAPAGSPRGTMTWHNVRVVITSVCALGFLLTAALLPSTEMVFKIAATKYGVDGITSDTVKEKFDRANKMVDDAMKIVEDKIEEKLDQAKAKK